MKAIEKGSAPTASETIQGEVQQVMTEQTNPPDTVLSKLNRKAMENLSKASASVSLTIF